MNQYETEIKNRLKAAQSAPPDELRERVLSGAGSDILPFVKARPVRKIRGIAVIAAIITFITATTALAYGSDVIETMLVRFGGSTARQVDRIVLNDGTKAVAMWAIEGTDPGFNLHPHFESVEFLNAEEFNAAISFDFARPPSIPEYLDFERGTAFLTTEEGLCTNFAFVTYRGYIGEDYVSNFRTLFILMQRVGEGASLSVTTTYGIEKIMVGEIEALLSFKGENRLQLDFVKNGIHYLLDSTLCIDTLIAIAKEL
jgi:hypothetical protein